MFDRLVGSIKKNEGLSLMPYKDSEGYWTIGYGTKLPLTVKEAEYLLESRLKRKMAQLRNEKEFITDLPEPIQEVLYEMTYQLGLKGCLKFKNMWKAVENRNWNKMILEMKDSKWYEQTPNRVQKLINKVIEYVNDN